MVLLSLFFLAAIDKTFNKKKDQTIGRNVKFGLTKKEYNNLTRGVNY